jgi:hypothetical protein
VSLARREFPQWVEQPAWSPPTLQRGERVAEYRGEHAMIIKREGERVGALAISPTPLATADDNGAWSPVDLTLEHGSAGFKPHNAAVPTRLPDTLVEGVAFAGLGLSLAAADGGDGQARRVEDKVFYDNVQQDADVMLAPLPTGVEVYYQLRSPNAPTAFTMKASGVGRLEFVTTADGGAVIRRDGETVATVMAPTAVDAQGQPVDVRYEACCFGWVCR